jgi:hypothetical protein
MVSRGLSARDLFLLVHPALRTGLWDFGPLGLFAWRAGAPHDACAPSWLCFYCHEKQSLTPLHGFVFIVMKNNRFFTEKYTHFESAKGAAFHSPAHRAGNPDSSEIAG